MLIKFQIRLLKTMYFQTNCSINSFSFVYEGFKSENVN
jgi:hypothetical protein